MTRRRKAVLHIIPIALMCALVPRAAFADDWEGWAGYSFMRDAKDQVTFPEGWTAGGARSLTPWLSVIGDVDGQRKDIPALGAHIVLTSHAFTAGARAAAKLGPVKQFAQVTSGVLLLHGDAFGSGQTTTTWVIAPGLGLDYAVAKAWAARLQVDVRFVRTGQQVRAVAAIVYRR